MKLILMLVVMVLFAVDVWASSRLCQTYGNSIVQLGAEKIEEKAEVMEAPSPQIIVIKTEEDKKVEVRAELSERESPNKLTQGYTKKGAYYFKDSSKKQD